MIRAYVKRVQKDGLISANSSLYCKLDEEVIPAIKTAIGNSARDIEAVADMANKKSMFTAIKTYLLHKLVLFLLGGSTEKPQPKSKQQKTKNK
jgi:hypothetical protein